MSDREAVLDELREMHEMKRKNWIKSKEIARRLGWTGQKVGVHLSQLHKKGKVEKWGGSEGTRTNNAWRAASGRDE